MSMLHHVPLLLLLADLLLLLANQLLVHPKPLFCFILASKKVCQFVRRTVHCCSGGVKIQDRALPSLLELKGEDDLLAQTS